MRFFKYLATLLLSIPTISFAALYEYNVAGEVWYSTPDSACTNWKHSAWQYDTVKAVVNGEVCEIRYKSNNALYNKATIKKREIACPTGREDSFKWWQDIAAPSMVCLRKCEYLKPPGPVKCVGVDFESPGMEQCGDYVSSGKTCTQPDPDPKTQPKPPLDPNECKNPTGSDAYCNKPSDRACPSGYKQAMFNNQQICVKDSPNTPNPNDPNNPPDSSNPPNDPNACTASYCPKPDSNKSCPTGYYATTHNGSNICVKNNPNDPNNPNNPTNNPNDPNNNSGGGNGGNGGNTGGGDGGGAFCDASGKALCDSILKIQEFLTGKPAQEDENSQIPSVSITDKSFQSDVFKVNASKCPSDKQINLTTPFGTFSKSFSFQYMCDETSFFGLIVLILAYSYAVNIVLRA